jgi:hypothetical protein
MPEEAIGVGVLVNEGPVGGRLAMLVATLAYDWWRGRPDALARAEATRGELLPWLDRIRARVAADLAARAARPWTLSQPAAAYAGTYTSPLYGTLVVTAEGEAPVLQLGRLRAVATPFTEPNTVRVELVPGQGEVIRFEVTEAGRVVRAHYDDAVFERAD